MNLREVAQLAHSQLFPKPTNTPPNSKEEFIASARQLYATEILLRYYSEKGREGGFELPAVILKEEEFDVVDSKITIPAKDILTSLPQDQWLQNVGGLMCKCKYIKTSLNTLQALCDDDSVGNARLYYPIGGDFGMTIQFPNGAHSKKLSVTYACKGRKMNESVEIDDGLAGIIRQKLIDLYGGKMGKEDTTNNANPEN